MENEYDDAGEKTYIEEHIKEQDELLTDLKAFLQKHRHVLYEEQYFAVWNKSQLSETVIHKEDLELQLNTYSGKIDISSILYYLANHFNVDIPDDWVLPKSHFDTK